MKYLGEQQRPCWNGSLIITNLLKARDKTRTVGFQSRQQCLLRSLITRPPGCSPGLSHFKGTRETHLFNKGLLSACVEWFFSYSSSLRLIPGFSDTIILNNRVCHLNTYGLTSLLKWIEKKLAWFKLCPRCWFSWKPIIQEMELFNLVPIVAKREPCSNRKWKAVFTSNCWVSKISAPCHTS